MAEPDAAIEAAKKHLRLKEVLILKLDLEVADRLSEKYGDTDAKVGFRHGCLAHKIIGDDDKSVRFKYQCGIRLVDSDVTPLSTDEIDEEDIAFEMKVVYAIDYQMKEQMSEEELTHFGKINVGYHVWPFWRELVQSTCGRIGITTIPLPFYKQPSIK